MMTFIFCIVYKPFVVQFMFNTYKNYVFYSSMVTMVFNQLILFHYNLSITKFELSFYFKLNEF